MKAKQGFGTALIAVLLAAGCGASGPPEKPAQVSAKAPRSQILITVEALAGRHVVPFGGLIAMPRLAEFVAAGTRYDDTMTTTTLARPALVTILTGVAPDRSGVRDNIHDALPADLPTLAEGARRSGYETAAFVSTPFASYASGLQRGFELFDGPEALTVGPAQHDPPVVASAAIASHVKDWLASRSTSKPYFVWIHLADLNGVSVPLQLPKIATGDQPVSDTPAYDAKLAAVDQGIGAIIDAFRGTGDLSQVDWTLVGTHGVCLGEGGRYGDAFWLTDETVQVPLARVSDLGNAAGGGKHDPRPTWLPDVAQTLAAAMQVTLGSSAEGVAVDAAPPADRARYAWAYALDDQLGWAPAAAVRTTAGLETTGPAVAARAAQPRKRELPAASRAAVETAGLKLGRGSEEAPLPRPEPWIRDLQLVRRYLAADRPGLAGERSRQVVKAAPEALASLVTRAFFFSNEPRKEGPPLRDKLLERFPNRSDALHWAAHLELVEKRYVQAQALLEAALAVGPVEPEMHYDLACVRSLRNDPTGALDELGRALSAGYRNWDWIDKDPDLSAMRADRRFPELLRTHGR